MTSLLQVGGGHGRRILPWIIEQSDTDDMTAEFRVTSMSTLHGQLWDAIHDLDELIELITELLRSGGIGVSSSPIGLNNVAVFASDQYLMVSINACPCRLNSEFALMRYDCVGIHVNREFSMPQARSLAADLLKIPNDSTASVFASEAERILLDTV